MKRGSQCRNTHLVESMSRQSGRKTRNTSIGPSQPLRPPPSALQVYAFGMLMYELFTAAQIYKGERGRGGDYGKGSTKGGEGGIFSVGSKRVRESI